MDSTPDRVAKVDRWGHRTERRGRVELCWTPNGFDEFVVYDESGKCIVHGEAMSEGSYWIGLYTGDPDDGRAVVNFGARSKKRIHMDGRWEE